jgi:uncharacterized protein YbaR (Trm112 family)
VTELNRPPTADPGHIVDPRTLEMLVCPLTKTQLTLDRDRAELISVAAHLAFPIRAGVPLLALDEARTMDQDELDRITRRPPNPDGIG